MYSFEDDCSQHLISEMEHALYSHLLFDQNKKFSLDIQVLIDGYLNVRCNRMDIFGIECGEKELKSMSRDVRRLIFEAFQGHKAIFRLLQQGKGEKHE